MTIKHAEEIVKEPITTIRERIAGQLHYVKFGPFDFYDSENRNFSKPWMGEFDTRTDEFKLFKTKQGTDQTSEFYLKGKLLAKVDYTTIRYAVKVHYMMIVGILGLNFFIYAISFLINAKGYLDIFWIWITACFIISILYILVKRRNYCNTLAAFNELLNTESLAEMIRKAKEYEEKEEDY